MAHWRRAWTTSSAARTNTKEFLYSETSSRSSFVGTRWRVGAGNGRSQHAVLHGTRGERRKIRGDLQPPAVTGRDDGCAGGGSAGGCCYGRPECGDKSSFGKRSIAQKRRRPLQQAGRKRKHIQ